LGPDPFDSDTRPAGNCGALFLSLERIKKYCSRSKGENKMAVFLGFGFVSAQLQGYSNLRLRQSLAKTPKILAPNGYSIF
jgi:hypothetical protein